MEHGTFPWTMTTLTVKYSNCFLSTLLSTWEGQEDAESRRWRKPVHSNFKKLENPFRLLYLMRISQVIVQFWHFGFQNSSHPKCTLWSCQASSAVAALLLNIALFGKHQGQLSKSKGFQAATHDCSNFEILKATFSQLKMVPKRDWQVFLCGDSILCICTWDVKSCFWWKVQVLIHGIFCVHRICHCWNFQIDLWWKCSNFATAPITFHLPKSTKQWFPLLIAWMFFQWPKLSTRQLANTALEGTNSFWKAQTVS